MTDYFINRERNILGDDFDIMYNAPISQYKAITCNLLRMPTVQIASLLEFETKVSPFCSDGLLVEDKNIRLGLHPFHHAGAYYVQEPSASAPCDILDVQPNDKVLDLCAAPGGKTSRLAAKMQGKGILVANEYNAQRANVLRSNLERMGVKNALVLHEDTSKIAKTFAGYFDKILVDTPCSGEGMFRKEPQAVTQHSEELVKQCASLGEEILQNAANCLNINGKLVYSTCTFSSEENEQQIAKFLQNNKDFVLLKIDVNFGSKGEQRRLNDVKCEHIEYTRRIYPCHGGEGQFMALLQRIGEPTTKAKLKNIRTKELTGSAKTFIEQYFPSIAKEKFLTAGEFLYLPVAQELPPIEKMHILRNGVQIGQEIKNRFVPAHHLFTAFGVDCEQKLNLNLQDKQVNAYLHGEEISSDNLYNGWLCVMCENVPLGAGKQSGQSVKNHYPKGLRNLK